jgi:hypothetical protein
LDNATAAVAIVQQLRDKGIPVSEQAIHDGLTHARWPGRFELLNRSPMLVVDSAHNENSAHKLRAALADYVPRPPRRQLCLVFGASSDKDIDGMLEQFLRSQSETGYPPADKVIVTKSGHPRSAEPAELADLVRKISSTTPISVQPDLSSALREALAWAGEHDLICITGSIFVVAQARREWAADHPEVFPPDDGSGRTKPPARSCRTNAVRQNRRLAHARCPFGGRYCAPRINPVHGALPCSSAINRRAVSTLRLFWIATSTIRNPLARP